MNELSAVIRNDNTYMEAKKAILRQQDSLQGKMFHENFWFSTTYHVKVPEEMSAIGNVSFESDGLTGRSTNVLGRDAE